GVGVRVAGDGTVPRAGRDRPRLPAGDGHDPRLRRVHADLQSHRRSRLLLARSAGAAHVITRTRIAVAVLVTIGLLAVAAPWLTPWSHDALDWRHLAAPPFEGTHWLGTDRLGRDLFARSMQAIRVSIALGVLAALVSVIIGVSWGATAGYLGGRVDALMMRFVDIVYALPYIFIVI